MAVRDTRKGSRAERLIPISCERHDQRLKLSRSWGSGDKRLTAAQRLRALDESLHERCHVTAAEIRAKNAESVLRENIVDLRG